MSGPTVGAKAAPAVRSVSASSTGTTSGVETQRVNGTSNMPLPSRPGSKPAAPPVAPAAQAPALSATPRVATPPAVAPPTLAPPAPTPPPVAPAVEAPSLGRGGLGSGWESSNEIGSQSMGAWGNQAPAASPPSGGLAGGWGTPAPAAPPPAPSSSWGAPSNPMETGKMPAWGSPSGGLSGGPGLGGPGLGGSPSGLGSGHAPGMGAGPPSGALGSPPSPGMGAASGGLGPPSGSLGGGGGWLGDGGNSSPYAPPPRQGGGWLGGEASNEAPATLTPSSELVAPQVDSPALSLPDHTVAVDLGTPWEDEIPQQSQSNRGVYAILGVFLVMLLGFFGYLKYQQNAIKKAPVAAEKSSGTKGSLDVGLDYLKQGQAFYQKKKWTEAQSAGEMAHTLIGGLSAEVASAEKKKAVAKFFRQSTQRAGQAFYDQASQALSAGDVNSVIGLSERSAQMYAKLSDTKKEQARAFALQGRAYSSLRDYVSAQSSYKTAFGLSANPSYQAALNEARRLSSAGTVPPPVADAPSGPAVQPSLGDDNVYPNGSGVRGSGRSSGSSTASGGDPAPAAVQRPRPAQSTYVPPKKDDRPSFMKKKEQRPPGY